ncbi:MAG: hypothetical protein IJ600_11665, partial [Lachnospiraceae bacterium]|nr:hypothetical protein [Lachnospiraceae bacterium]
IYKSIVKISKDEPVFLMDRSKDVEKYTISMKENAMKFRSDVGAIGGLDDATIFNQKTAFSSEPSIAEVVDHGGHAGETEDGADAVELTVRQLAKPQENMGKFLRPDVAGIEEGNYSFDVATLTSNYELQFTISEGDTNKDIQGRLARLINNFNLGLQANVEEDDVGNTALVIRSKAVGDKTSEGGHFSISDENTSQKSGIVDYLGIRKPSQEGTDAIYIVNGETRTSSGNEVRLNKTYDVKLKAEAPDQTVTIGYKPDVESMKDNILSLAGSYNNFIKATAEYVEQQPRTSLLVKDMKSTGAYYTAGLAKLGVTQEQDGTLSVDEEKLAETLKSEDGEGEIDTLKDFTKSALRKANQVQLNPMDYVDKRIVAYKNPTKPHYANPYITSAYSGMLFNGYM